MKNFLIRLLGGITPDEFSQLISAHNSAMRVKEDQLSDFRGLLRVEHDERQNLQTIILKKTGMIPPEHTLPSVEQILNPISTRPKSWREQRNLLEKQDADRVAEQWKKKDPTAKLNSEMLGELNASKIS